jgi:hypothetical protein
MDPARRFFRRRSGIDAAAEVAGRLDQTGREGGDHLPRPEERLAEAGLSRTSGGGGAA